MSKNSSLHLQDILLREKGTQGWSQTPSTGFGGRCQQAVLRVWVGVCVCVCACVHKTSVYYYYHNYNNNTSRKYIFC